MRHGVDYAEPHVGKSHARDVTAVSHAFARGVVGSVFDRFFKVVCNELNTVPAQKVA